MEDVVWWDFDAVEHFMRDGFVAMGVPEADAAVCADVLITADKRGIDSHGVGRFKPIYVDRIRAAPLEELQAVPGMNRRAAQALKEHL